MEANPCLQNHPHAPVEIYADFVEV